MLQIKDKLPHNDSDDGLHLEIRYIIKETPKYKTPSVRGEKISWVIMIMTENKGGLSVPLF